MQPCVNEQKGKKGVTPRDPSHSSSMDIDIPDDYEEAEEWEDASVAESGYEYEEQGGEDDDDDDQEEEEEQREEEQSQIDRVQSLERESKAEKAIEGDFRRLVDNIKQGTSKDMASSSGSIWDINIEEAEGFDIHDELRTASGIGRRKRRRRGPRDQPVLSQQVKALLGEGNAAYVAQDISETVRLMQEVIRIEPRVPAAWATLALCYQDDQPEKALKLKIIRAHLVHDVDLWLGLGNESTELGYLQQALYCYRKACTLDPADINAQWERASLSKELGDFRTAKAAFLSILKQYPHDISALEELRPVLVELGDLPKGIELYQQAFDFYHEKYPSGTAATAQTQQTPETLHPSGGFADMQIIVLADFYNSIGHHEKALTTVKKGVRWLQGRAEQRYWDKELDDREFDVPGVRRPDQYSSMLPMSYPLEINFRHRLAVARLAMGDFEEGKLHSGIMLQYEAREHAVLFTELADTMFEQELFEDALGIYETLSADETTSNFNVVFQAAACHRNMGHLKEAAEIYQHILSGDSDNIDTKMKLAEVYEAMSEPKKALDLVYEVIDARRRAAALRDGQQNRGTFPGVGIPPGDSLFQEKPFGHGKPKRLRFDGMTLVQLQALELEHEAATKRGFERCKELEEGMKKGDPEAEAVWLGEAEKLIESFRQIKPLFPSTKIEFRGMPAWRRSVRKAAKAKAKANEDQDAEENDMASRLQLEIEYDRVAPRAKKKPGEKATEFRCVSFQDWLMLFVEYAFLLTKRDEYALAEEVLRHAMQAVVFQEPDPLVTLRLSLIACALRAKDYDTIVVMARKLINSHQFHNGPPKLLLASLASGLLSVDAFINSKLQKHLSREMRLMDAAVKGGELRWNPHNKRYHLVGVEEGGKEDVEEAEETPAQLSAPNKPTRPNPVLVCIYGQLCIAAKSYQSAIFYLLHAYDYQPNDPVICLSLAVAYLGRAMQRQSDNRNYMIAESLAFLSRYRNIRAEGNIDEVEFNFGRAFHQIGLFHYAQKHYERVLSNTEARMKTDPNDRGLSREAAYNLSLIYMATGANGLARDLYRQWLTL